MSTEGEGFAVVFDVEDPKAWRQARRYRRYWGVLYTELYLLDDHRVAMIFKSSGKDQWKRWEETRKSWILKELQGNDNRTVSV